MSPLATLEIALRQSQAYSALADSHVHRATREDSLGIIKGRDAITAAWVNEDAGEITIDHDLGDMIAYTVNGTWKGHRWVWREEGRILREVVIEDRGEPRTAPPAHPPLGELRSGLGQYAATSDAILSPDWPEDARDIAHHLHRIWNARSFDQGAEDWVAPLVRALPDATFTFERAIVSDGKTAILWRVQGHHSTGQRVRLIGSSVVVGGDVESVIDHAAMEAQLERELVDYGAAG